ncbi:MAG: ATP-grasp domain-containing protein [Bdellovibrionaceae bacterium]|nr:ATP-grasp domain-containing protein [Pseudobdellovibrionaceae bacterium]
MKSLKVLLLFDLSITLNREEYIDYWNTPDWKTERDVRNTLIKLGHEVIPLGIHDDIDPFLKIVKEQKPDLVFNMSEAFSGQRNFEPNLTALMELVGVPFTGAGPMSLQLCKDKGLTKSILGYHEISTPKFLVAKKSRPFPLSALRKFPFPAFIKPLQLESSEGIAQMSYAVNAKEAVSRVKYIHDKLGVDAIVEEFIDGREVYVSILGNDKLSVFPPRELFFKQIPADEPKFATFKSKWDREYRKKWGIDSGWVDELPEGIQKKLNDVCKKIYRLLNIQGFGRIDLRIRGEEIYFIEANPNPSISKKEDYALSAHKAGIDYDELIARIVSLSLSA